MAIRNALLGGTDLVNGTVGDSDDINDTFDAVLKSVPENRLKSFPTLVSGITNMAVHSSSIWSVILSTGAIHNTTDSGANWTSKNTDLDTNSDMVTCATNFAYAICIESGSATAEVALTANSGSTWTTKTSVSFGSSLYDIAYPTTGLIIVAGNEVGTRIQRSTDSGANWASASTAPTDNVIAVTMYDGNVGYCIENSQNIWKTTNDAGATWADTGHNTNIAANKSVAMYCLSSTKVIIAGGTYIELYDNAAGTVTKLITLTAYDACLGIKKATNGNILVMMHSSTAPINNLLFILNGTTGAILGVRPFGAYANVGNYYRKHSLHEISDGYFAMTSAFFGGYDILFFNRSEIA